MRRAKEILKNECLTFFQGVKWFGGIEGTSHSKQLIEYPHGHTVWGFQSFKCCEQGLSSSSKVSMTNQCMSSPMFVLGNQ